MKAAENSHPDFYNTQNAFAYKSDKELKLAYRMFKLVQNRRLVKLGSRLSLFALKLRLPINGIIKKTLFPLFVGGENLGQAVDAMKKLDKYHVDTVLDYAAEGAEDEASFEHAAEVILENVRRAANNKLIKLISVKLTGMAPKALLEKIDAGITLSDREKELIDKSLERLDKICLEAENLNVIVYIDAEESWLQKPMDDMTLLMMERYNKKRAIVFNTFQMYRTDRLPIIQNFLEEARNKDFIAGIKIVRGAYLEKEQKRAKEMGYPSPVYFKKEDTDKNFNSAITLTMEHIKHAELCIASHNEASTLLAIRLLETPEYKPYKDRVAFSQLYGMSDNLTFNLAKSGYQSSKYLPYGTVPIAMPYLLRRAEENTSISGQMSRELEMIELEMKRRELIKK